MAIESSVEMNTGFCSVPENSEFTAMHCKAIRPLESTVDLMKCTCILFEHVCPYVTSAARERENFFTLHLHYPERRVREQHQAKLQ